MGGVEVYVTEAQVLSAHTELGWLETPHYLVYAPTTLHFDAPAPVFPPSTVHLRSVSLPGRPIQNYLLSLTSCVLSVCSWIWMLPSNGGGGGGSGGGMVEIQNI